MIYTLTVTSNPDDWMEGTNTINIEAPEDWDKSHKSIKVALKDYGYVAAEVDAIVDNHLYFIRSGETPDVVLWHLL